MEMNVQRKDEDGAFFLFPFSFFSFLFFFFSLFPSPPLRRQKQRDPRTRQLIMKKGGKKDSKKKGERKRS